MVNNECTKVTVNNDNYHVDWLLDYVFNNGELITYTGKDKRQGSHYDDKFEWDYHHCQTLTLTGKIQKRANDKSPWNVFQ